VTLTPMAMLVTPAREARRGLAAFNAIHIEHAEAIVAGAERAGTPVVLQLSQNTVAYHRALAPLALACLRIAADSTTAVCVHLDHATEPDLVEEAVGLGIASVMFDAAHLPHAANVARTAQVATWCHEHGVWVEGELGAVGGKDGVHAPGVRTDPDEAVRYVASTGVDALAVAVGSSHAKLVRDTVLDEPLIATLAARVPVPLVLHGSSGVPDAGLVGAVRAGLTKINIATHLNKALTGAVREALGADGQLVDPRGYLGAGRDAMADAVYELATLLAGTRIP
jgi:fructose-bisphosphate aldolase, class II